MNHESITCLLIEDNPGDARLIQEMLLETNSGQRVSIGLEVTDRLSKGLGQIENEEIDVVLLDLSLPDSQGLETLHTALDQAPDLPIIVLTGLDDEELGFEAVQHGAQDYLVKGQVGGDLLVRAIRYAIERKNALGRLQLAYEELDDANRLKEEMIQNISHEFRTPLSYVVGYLALLSQEMDQTNTVSANQRHHLEIVTKQVDKLVELLDNFTAIRTTDEIAQSTELAEAATLLEESVTGVELRAEEAGITVEIHAEDLPPVLVNRMAISQVLDNLLSNAIKFTPNGGSITARAWLNPANDKVHISVADTGIGIPQDEQARIFMRFYQVDGSMTRKYAGMGLGLAVCREILDAHGESIWVDSVPDEGTTFTFSLPTPGESFEHAPEETAKSEKPVDSRARQLPPRGARATTI